MFLPVTSHYELIVDAFKDKGVQITMRKTKGLQPLIPVALFTGLLFAYFNGNLTGVKVYLSLSAMVIITISLFNIVCSIHKETLLIIASIGITVRRSNLLGTTSKFYSVHEIQDVVIVEAVTMYKIIFQLVLIPKDKDSNGPQVTSQNTDNGTKKLHPLFHNFKPKLKDLQIVYKHIQEKLFDSVQKGTR